MAKQYKTNNKRNRDKVVLLQIKNDKENKDKNGNPKS
jgi:hypothetical protein